jgi:hypothetical protein
LFNKDELYSKLEKIGFRVTATGNKRLSSKEDLDIEKIFIEALYQIDSDGRLLGLLFSWLSVHGSHLIADKFFKEYEDAKKFLGESPWFNAVCSFMMSQKDHRFKKGALKLKKSHSFGNRDQDTLIKLKGSVDFLADVGIQVPISALRIREQDVFSIEELVKSNLQYRNRYVFGANWRAEIITSIQNGAHNANQVAKHLGIAPSRVGIVFKEYMQVRDLI